MIGIFVEQVVCVADFCDVRIKDFVVLGKIHLRLRECFKILCRAAENGHMRKFVLSKRGAPMDKIFLVFFVKENFRCPQAAEVITPHVNKLFFGEMHKVIRFPHTQALAARAVDFFPVNIVVFVHAVHNAKIGCQHNKTTRMQTDDGDVAAPLFTELCSQHGICIVDSFPVESVTADGKINLFSVGSQFFFEVRKKIRHCDAPFTVFAEHCQKLFFFNNILIFAPCQCRKTKI